MRLLITGATGTGKTFIAFQVAWKLFHSRWNLTDWKKEGEPTRRPRILFLADRNILANQAFNAFSAFAEDALVRIYAAGGILAAARPCALRDVAQHRIGAARIFARHHPAVAHDTGLTQVGRAHLFQRRLTGAGVGLGAV